MCGISGIVSKRDATVSQEQIKRINHVIAHRGPDDEGYYFGENFALGHRRLSILDLSSDGHQPMAYAERYTISYNGEVYNYLELREELEGFGHSFRSHTDTEVILAAYAEWGSACVEKFNGMWAFAIYDAVESRLFLSRDRFGIKPLYYTDSAAAFCFGSELRQLLPMLDRRVVDKAVLLDYLVSNFLEHRDETFFVGIKKLPASHSLIYDLKTHSYEISRYYSICRQTPGNENINSACHRYRDLLDAAVNLRLRSDVRVGTCLSGGLDSSSVATLAATRYAGSSDEPFTAITSKASDPEVDESMFAKMVVEQGKMRWCVIEPGYDEFVAAVDEVVVAQEEPFGGPSIFMQYFVMREAKKQQCKVMLDGQGGDETLLGYERYYPSAYLDVFRKKGFAAAVRAVRQSSKNNSKMSLFWVIKYSVGTFFSSLRKVYNRRKCSFLKSEYRQSYLHLDELAASYRDVFDMQVMEITRTNLPELLRYEDKNSMQHSVEARLPMLDYRVVEQALNTDTRFKIVDGWTKYLLRKAMKNLLPEKIVWRKNKFGFNAPERSWLSLHEEKMVSEVKQSKLLAELCDMEKLLKKYTSMSGPLRWRLYNIACWERLFDVGAR